MIWSRLKTLSEKLLAAALQGRVEYHLTRYGPGLSDLMTRGWITTDGREILSCSTIKQVREGYRLTGKWYADDQATLDQLHSQGLFTRGEFIDTLEEYVRSPIETALQSVNPLARAIALLDHRAGKRRLRQIVLRDDEPQVIKDFYRIRCEAEGLLPAHSEIPFR